MALREQKCIYSSPVVLSVKPQWVWNKLVLAVMWEQVTYCKTDRNVCRGSTDMIANPVHYIIFILVPCRGHSWVGTLGSSETLTHSWFGIISRLLHSAVWQTCESSSWEKWACIVRFLWMRLEPLNTYFSGMRRLIHIQFWPFNTSQWKGNFLLHFSWNCWDTTAASFCLGMVFFNNTVHITSQNMTKQAWQQSPRGAPVLREFVAYCD